MIKTTLEEQGRRILQREKELGLDGPISIPINDGSRRTLEKRALLRTIRDHARAEGREPRFYAMIGDGTD
jgi:hypothetical protein